MTSCSQACLTHTSTPTGTCAECTASLTRHSWRTRSPRCEASYTSQTARESASPTSPSSHPRKPCASSRTERYSLRYCFVLVGVPFCIIILELELPLSITRLCQISHLASFPPSSPPISLFLQRENRSSQVKF